MALGLLGQKLKAGHHPPDDGAPAEPRNPDVPLRLVVAVEREARRMAGYLYGAQIAQAFLGLWASDPESRRRQVEAYLAQQADPRLAEIVGRLEALCPAAPDEV
jgi:hypothetical protein